MQSRLYFFRIFIFANFWFCDFNFCFMENFVISETSEQEKYLEKYFGKDSFVEIPGEIAAVGEESFFGNKNLEKVDFFDGADSIGGYAFFFF